MESDIGFQTALEEARAGFNDDGVPIGAALVAADGTTILGRGVLLVAPARHRGSYTATRSQHANAERQSHITCLRSLGFHIETISSDSTLRVKYRLWKMQGDCQLLLIKDQLC